MNGCREIREDLSALVDGQLPATRRADVEAHLLDCPRCRDRVAQLKQLAAGIAALPELPSPPGFLADVRRRIRAGEHAHPPVTWLDVLFRPVWLKVPLEAVALVVVFGTVLALVRPQPRTELAKAPSRSAGEIRWDLPVPAASKASREEAPVGFGFAGPAAESSEPVAPRETDGSALALNRSAAVGIRRDVVAINRGQIELPQAPSETLIVEAKSVAEVQSQAEEAAIPLQGKLIVPAGDARARNFFVELPAANAAMFKRQFAVVQQQAAQETKPLSLADDLSGLQGTGDAAPSYADVDRFTGVKTKAEAESHNRSVAAVAAPASVPAVEAGGVTTVLEIQVVSPRPTGR